MKNLFLVLAFISNSAFASFVVGKVDVQKVLVSVEEGKVVKSKLKTSFEKKQKELKSEEDKIRKLQEKFQKQTAALSNQAKTKKQREIQEKIMKLQQKSMSYQKEMQSMEQKYRDPILKRIQPLIQTVSKEAKVDVTFEVNSTPVVYAKKDIDLTDKVIKAYNKKYPSKK